MKNICTPLFLLALLLGFSAQAQDENDDFCYITLRMTAKEEKVERARFYQSARENLKVEFTKLVFKGSSTSFGIRVFAKYDKEKDLWTARVPKGMYRMRTVHLGFNTIRETVECEQASLELNRKLEVDTLPYTYDNGSTYNYIRGGIEFSETVIVHFKGGTPDENKAFLETFPFEKVQKMRYVNAFFLTLNLSNQESLPEILIRETMGDEPLNEGFYFGDAVTKTIEKIIQNPNVDYANPTFVFPKKDVQVLTVKDFATVKGLTTELKNRRSDEPKRLDPDEFEKTDELKQKLLRELEEK